MCGTARPALAGLPCSIHIVFGTSIDIRKEEFVRELGPEHVVAVGNGCNDRRMLKAARLKIAVSWSEGCSTDALMASDVRVCRVIDAFDLLLKPKRCKASLRF
jgi:soluble P-type ATPase